ncbi:MAG: protein BatD [Epsilonproteobacteria bacterium]|nr:protein BatD [Campylobacterota bacterium]
MILVLLFATFLFANEKLLMANFTDLKPYYYNHQIVNLHLKIIAAKNGILNLTDDMNRTYPVNNHVGNIVFELNNTFPHLHLTLQDTNQTILDELNITIASKIKQLYPPKNFCGVIAKDIIISDKVLTNYDNNSNIVYWTIKTILGNAHDFTLHQQNEKMYFLDKNDTSSSYSYSAIVPRDKRDFDITYFDLDSEKYKTITIHIKLKNEKISTQTDIKPISKSNILILNTILGILILLWAFLFYKKGKITYIISILIAFAILVILNFPKKEITLPQGQQVHILPFDNSTVFFVAPKEMKAKVLKTRNGYKKIEFANQYIGWIKMQ